MSELRVNWRRALAGLGTVSLGFDVDSIRSVYFADDFTSRVFEAEPYAARGERDTLNSTDGSTTRASS